MPPRPSPAPTERRHRVRAPTPPGDEGCRPGAAGPVVARCRVRRRRPRRGGGDCPRRLAHRKHRADGDTTSTDGDGAPAEPCRNDTAVGPVPGEGPSSQACGHVDDHLARGGGARGPTGHQLAHPPEWERRAEHSGRGRQLPQLEWPNRGHVQRHGGTDELPRRTRAP